MGIASLQKNIFERAFPLKTKKAITLENYEPIGVRFLYFENLLQNKLCTIFTGKNNELPLTD